MDASDNKTRKSYSKDSCKKENDAEIQLTELDPKCKQREVTSSRMGRTAQMCGLFAGLAIGTVTEYAKRVVGLSDATDVESAMLSPGNMQLLANKLCKLRGAALKLGQVLSMQSSKSIPPELMAVFDRVRQSADYMPDHQMNAVMVKAFGKDWRLKFQEFTEKPFAAASIGQVHHAVLPDGRAVAVKIQYMNISKSIESDINSLATTLRMFNLCPKGEFFDDIMAKVKRELAWEVDYGREASCQSKYRGLIKAHKEFYVPHVYDEWSNVFVLTSEFVQGVPVDKCIELDSVHRHFVGTSLLKLVFVELFEMRCIQADSNWSNYLYDAEASQIKLLDFGATRFFEQQFISDYKEFLRLAAAAEREKLLALSIKMKFLDDDDDEALKEAHLNAAIMFGEIFRCDEYDFGETDLTERLSKEVEKSVEHRRHPLPEEIYSINRKLTGIVALCAKLNVRIDCQRIYNDFIARE